jgi:large subunit ribosomal protein L22
MYEARALRRNIHSSPRKMRLVIDLIRGKNATDALGILRFSAHHASKDAELALKSAVANLQRKMEQLNKHFDEDECYVKEVFVNQGTTMKRMLPAPQGRAYRVRKRSNHLTIIVGTK